MKQQIPHMGFIVAFLGTLVLAGCGGDPVLSDRLVEDKGAEAYLDRVEKNCGNMYVGSQQIRYLLGVSNDDAYFLDETSKLYFGRVDQKTYASNIHAFYLSGTNQSTLDCIFQQLDK